MLKFLPLMFSQGASVKDNFLPYSGGQFSLFVIVGPDLSGFKTTGKHSLMVEQRAIAHLRMRIKQIMHVCLAVV